MSSITNLELRHEPLHDRHECSDFISLCDLSVQDDLIGVLDVREVAHDFLVVLFSISLEFGLPVVNFCMRSNLWVLLNIRMMLQRIICEDFCFLPVDVTQYYLSLRYRAGRLEECRPGARIVLILEQQASLPFSPELCSTSCSYHVIRFM